MCLAISLASSNSRARYSLGLLVLSVSSKVDLVLRKRNGLSCLLLRLHVTEAVDLDCSGGADTYISQEH